MKSVIGWVSRNRLLAGLWAILLIAVGITLLQRSIQTAVSPSAVTVIPVSPSDSATGTQKASLNDNSTQGSPTLSASTGKSKNSTYFFIRPLLNDQLVIKEGYDIAWSKAPGRAGYITLASALDKKPVGVITSNTDANQTFYRWDGHYVFVGRYSPVRKEVTSGSYFLTFIPDGPGAPSFSSSPFQLVYADQIAYSTHTVTIEKNLFSPATLSVKRGDTIVFTNKDSLGHTLGSSHLGQTYVAPDANFTVNTGLISTVSEVKFYDPNYSAMNFVLTIR